MYNIINAKGSDSQDFLKLSFRHTYLHMTEQNLGKHSYYFSHPRRQTMSRATATLSYF